MAYRSGRGNRFGASLLRVIQQKRCKLLVPPIRIRSTHHRVGISDGRGGNGIGPGGASGERSMELLPTNQTWWPVVRVLLIAVNTGLIAWGWFIFAITRSIRYRSCESIGGTLSH